jgi:predicted DNA-binding protein
MKRVQFHLTEKQIKQLKDLSKKTGLSVAELIRRAVDAFLQSQNKGG